MTAMWVDPRFRKRGVGDLLVKTLLDWARSNGYAQMLLWVTDGNGFVRTGAAQDVRPGHLEYEMARTL